MQEKQEKSKETEEKRKSRMWLKFLICIVVAFVIVMIECLIVEKIKNSTKTQGEEGKYYKIENIGNIEFENVYITIKNNMSYINIDLINKEKHDIPSQDIIVQTIKEGKEVEYLYRVPDIERGQTYNINLMTTGDLINVEKINIIGIEG